MTVSYSLKDIAEHIGADVCGDNDFRISGISTLRLADANELAFLANSAYRQDLERTKAGVVILSPEMVEHYSGQKLIVTNPILVMHWRLLYLIAHRLPSLVSIPVPL